MQRLWFGVLVFLLVTAGACTHTASQVSTDAAPAAAATTAPAGAPPSLSLVSTMGLLAFAADAGGMTLKGDSLKDSLEMQKLLETQAFPNILQHSGRQYDLVWGPVVNAGPNLKRQLVVDNAMYVARERGTGNYVIGIAGTDARSLRDWLTDFAIIPVPWPYVTDVGAISTGSLTGLRKLEEMKPHAGTKQPGVTLAGFLASVAGQPVTIYVAGHSLGGALCEVLGMWLADTRASWDPGRNATIVPMSFAGPTPGNSRWVAHFDAAFRNSGAARVWNENDVVPHAWNKRLMQKLPNLYPGSPPTIAEQLLINTATGSANLFDYQQVLGGGTPFQGALDPDVRSYTIQVVRQHICAYYAFFGVPAPPSRFCPAAN
ncbi:MAG TPA: hypothetical protein VEK57_09495 [Thermoanaerobaculia bacterium]|nr:hypothetical protein [Thermoanaerobaculia bacterium]